MTSIHCSLDITYKTLNYMVEYMYLIIFRVPKPVHKLTVMIISPSGSDVAKVYCLYLCEVYLLALDLYQSM